VKLAVVLFNLGGPDSLEAVEPFLTNLFSDPAVISLPAFLRLPLARLIAKKRGPIAREIYAKIGGRSPILPETMAQAAALERALGEHETRCFIAMRCWKPFTEEAARAIAAWSPDNIVLLPLYPQFSTTTTGSALDEWRRAARVFGIAAPTTTICCYPRLAGFIEGLAGATRDTLAQAKPGISYRVLISAHGLPKRVIARGDPYQVQVEQTAAALVDQLGITDWTICYQSRVGPLEWIGPSTDAEIRRAGAEGKGVVIVPVAFVSEHSETLVELDIEYAKLAREAGVPAYLRVPTVSVRAEFIAGLAGLVRESLAGDVTPRHCPPSCPGCGKV
jgi:ferrochelatase